MCTGAASSIMRFYHEYSGVMRKAMETLGIPKAGCRTSETVFLYVSRRSWAMGLFLAVPSGPSGGESDTV